MKANELMIGDWVYNRNIDKPMQVYPMMFSQIFRTHPDATTEDYNIFPIPLTPEILEKNGFVSREDLVEWIDEALPFIYENKETTESIVIGWRDSYDNGLRDENALVLKEYWQINVDGISANYEKTASALYVHELQHALRLCGIEKEIVL